MLIEDLIARYTRPLYEGEQEGGSAAVDGGGAEGGENTGGDAGAGGDGAAEETGTKDGAPSVAVDGGTAEGEDNTDGDGTSEQSGGDTADGAKDGDGEEGDKGDKDGEGDETSYEPFDIPEGLEVDETMLDSVTPIMRELGLEQEQAQKLVSAYADVVQQQAEAQAAAIKETFEGWVETAKKDPEIGGDKWDQTVERANAVLRKLGTKELIDDVIVGNGMGNHPEVIRLLNRAADELLSDEAPTGKQTDASGPVALESAWYGDTTPSAKKG